MSDQSPQPFVVVSPKNMGITIILTCLFGPLGLLYSTVVGGLVMLPISVVLGFLTGGISVIITQPICIIWGVVATNKYNRKIMDGKTNV